jgi:hypothetical protein
MPQGPPTVPGAGRDDMEPDRLDDACGATWQRKRLELCTDGLQFGISATRSPFWCTRKGASS